MTTPERLRRRQRIEGAFLVFIGIMLAISTLWFRHQDDKQRECIGDNFSASAETLGLRAELAQKDARASRVEGRATRWESQANQDFYADLVNGGTQATFGHVYARYIRRVGVANKERIRATRIRDRVRTIRADNPIPAFPEGTCE